MPPPATFETIRYKPGAVKTLGWENDATAMSLLKRAVAIGEVLMARHRLEVAVIEEFFPPNPGLLGLNWNGGDKIQVRLRPPLGNGGRGRGTHFYRFEGILCTLLHELAHCRHMNHGRAFWAFYHQLVAEAERMSVPTGGRLDTDLMEPGSAVGGTGTGAGGFGPGAGTGRKLGGRGGGRGHVLGGSMGRDTALAPTDAARLAVIRRFSLEDASRMVATRNCCGTQAAAGAAADDCCDNSGAATQEGQAPAQWECQLCTLLNDSRFSSCQACGLNPQTGDIARENSAPAEEGAAAGVEVADDAGGDDEVVEVPAPRWTCRRCTLVNPSASRVCAVCEADPAAPPLEQRWTCSQCTLRNPVTASRCTLCDGPRPPT